jgi:hypothetical protein
LVSDAAGLLALRAAEALLSHHGFLIRLSDSEKIHRADREPGQALRAL